MRNWQTFRLRSRRFTPLHEVWQALFRTHRNRTFVGLSLMAAQAFFYNAVFFTYALVLTDFYDIRGQPGRLVFLPFAAGNFLGPLLLGRLFDTVGRRPMIAMTYALSGLLLALTGGLFAADVLSATWQTVAWTIIFFFASAAASSAYLTVSETFPLEVRALAIACFYAMGTGYRRDRGAMAVRRPDRHGLAGEPIRRLSLGGGLNARCSADRVSILRCCRSGGRSKRSLRPYQRPIKSLVR